VKYARVIDARSRIVGGSVGVADGWWSRLRGLLGKPPLQPGEGLMLTPCTSVHMFGMKYPLDVAFLDREGRVVAAYRGLAPGGRSRWHREARHALELPSGTLAQHGIQEGDVLSWEVVR
jgi:uncharacterized protein